MPTLKEALKKSQGKRDLSGAIQRTGEARQEELSGFQNVMRILNKPGSGIRGGIKAFQEDRDISEGISKGFESGDVFVSDLFSEEFKRQNPRTAGALGFLGDVVTDPLTFIPASAGAKALKLAGKGLKAGTKAVPGGRRLSQELGKRFIPGKQFPQVHHIFRQGRGKAEKAGQLSRGRYERLSKELTPTPELTTQFEKNLIDSGNRAIRELDIVDRRATSRLSRRGLIEPEKFTKKTGLRHVSHMTTAEADKALKSSATRKLISDLPEDIARDPDSIIKWANDPKLQSRGYFKGQTFMGVELREGTIQEINKVFQAKTGKNFFEDDLVKLVVNKELRSKRVAIANDMLTDIIHHPDLTGDILSVPKGARIPKGFRTIDHPLAEGKIFHKDIAREIETGMRGYGIAEQNAFLRQYDKTLTWWKRWTLSPFPAYHTRNFIGDSWNNFLGGVKPGQSYNDAMRMVIGKVDDVKVKGGGKTYTGKEIEDAFVRNGLDMGTFWKAEQAGEVAERIGQAREPVWKRLISPQSQGPMKNAFLQAGEFLGQRRENFGRYQHMIEMLKRGKTPQEAVLSVKKFLFDYADLTPFEQRFMKRIVPFYTWTRKNVPLQVEQAILQPGKFLAIPKLGRNLEQTVEEIRGENVPRELLPDWAKTAGTIRLGEDPKGRKRYMPTTGFLPASDLSDLTPSGVGEKFRSGLSPFIKAPVEYLANKDIYFGQEIDPLRKTDPGILRELGLIGKVTSKSFRPATTIKDILKKDRTLGQIVVKHVFGANVKATSLEDLKKWRRYSKADKVRRLKSALKKARKNGNERAAIGLIRKLHEVRNQ